MKTIMIDYFSDVLCIWAYAAQIRLDQLKREFGGKVEIRYHFIPVLGVVEKRIGECWQDKGGYAGFGAYLLDVCCKFPHIEVNPQIWQKESSYWQPGVRLIIQCGTKVGRSSRRLSGVCDELFL